MIPLWEVKTSVKVAIAAILLAAIAVGGVAYAALSPADWGASYHEIVIPPGAEGYAIGRILKQEGIIRWVNGFVEYLELTHQETKLQAGRYQLCGCESVPHIVRDIVSGKALSTDVQVTIPEGSNIWQIDKILADAKLTQLGMFSRMHVNQEGTLFPDTYRFAKDATHTEIAAKMVAEFTDRSNGATPKQVAIASILEKEAKTPEDMALVAGIIAKRTRMQMPLQIDATVGYGWCLAKWLPTSSLWLCDTTQAPIATEIKIDGPYNTYTRVGLPAGPISNPGEAALNAALHPTDSDYLYYLSTRDGSKIIYSKTLQEHLANRRKYLGF